MQTINDTIGENEWPSLFINENTQIRIYGVEEIWQLPAFTLDSSFCLTALHKRGKGEPARSLKGTEPSVNDIKAQVMKSDYRQF
jgi:hypothetical protein